MGRKPVAALLGVVGFALYVVLVVNLAEFVIPLHWTVELAFFVVTGIAWAPPAAWLMRWALEPPPPGS